MVLKDLPPTLAGRVAVASCAGAVMGLMFVLIQTTIRKPR